MALKIKSVQIIDHSQECLEALEKQVQQGLEAIGLTAEGYAKKDCPVDTGRLRNSITYAIREKQGNPNKDSGEKAKAEDYAMRGEPEIAKVYIGTNVEYAPVIEYKDMNHKSGKAHFLRDAATNHRDEYKEIMKAALKD